MCNEISARERKRNKIGIFKMCNEILNVQWLMCNLKKIESQLREPYQSTRWLSYLSVSFIYLYLSYAVFQTPLLLHFHYSPLVHSRIDRTLSQSEILTFCTVSYNYSV